MPNGTTFNSYNVTCVNMIVSDCISLQIPMPLEVHALYLPNPTKYQKSHLSSMNSGIKELATEHFGYNKLSLFCGNWLWAKRCHLLLETRADVQRRAFMMLMNSGLSEAPPTKKPSTSGCVASSLQFSDVTEPVIKYKVTSNADITI